MEIVSKILSKLATRMNFFDLVDLSKDGVIDISKHLYLCPDININKEFLDRNKKTSYDEKNLNDLISFKLIGDEKIYTSKIYFLENIEDVVYLKFNTFNTHIEYFVTKGKKYLDKSEHIISIEYELHNLESYALIHNNNKYYAIFGYILSKNIFNDLTRIDKLSTILNKEFNIKNKLKELNETEINNTRKKNKKNNKKYTTYYPKGDIKSNTNLHNIC